MFSTVNITSNWISEIQQCFLSTQRPCGRIQYFKSQLLGNNILAFTFNFCIDFIDFFVFIITYAITAIAYLVINLVMPYVDVYTKAVVISISIKQIN